MPRLMGGTGALRIGANANVGVGNAHVAHRRRGGLRVDIDADAHVHQRHPQALRQKAAAKAAGADDARR